MLKTKATQLKTAKYPVFDVHNHLGGGKDHLTPGRVWVYEEWTSSETLEAHLNSHWYRDMGAHLRRYERKAGDNIIKKYRVDHEEPVYDDEGVARGHFFTAQ